MLNKETEISELKGIGSKTLPLYHNLKIYTVSELLSHIPFRYRDTSNVISISQFKEQGEGTFLAEIEDIKTTYFRKKITTVKIKDDTGTLRLVFFNQPYLSNTLNKNSLYLFDAKYTTSRNGKTKNIYNPKFEKFKESREKQLHIGKIIGIYPETKGLTSAFIRRMIKGLENDIPRIFKDPLEKYIMSGNLKLTPIADAIKKVHFPRNQEDIKNGRERLAFDEMLRIALKIESDNLKRKELRGKRMKILSKYLNLFIKSLPYKLTNDQSHAIEEILEDCSSRKPMNRLLNGDVGSGKTVVCATAILNCIKNGYSAILLAPTTILATQHYNSFRKLFKDFDIEIELAISSEKNISDADNKLIIGTHAILFEKNLPKDMNLVVIDEQHRFGVEQREFFKRESKYTPHYLTMTATPIPRSLTEIFFGGLDVSEIREKPLGRKEVKTYYTPSEKRLECFNWVREKILEDKERNLRSQAFVIYPLIDESDASNYKSVLNEFESLKNLLNGLHVEYLHGRLKDCEKERILEDFRDGKIDMLFSTTVIEVGIDIPNATMMIIEDADKFGLAQLHQLRGRIGRNERESSCFLIPSSIAENDSSARERLMYFAEHVSGFEVAEYDLRRRGPGEVYGIRQSGIPIFKVADIYDINLLRKARDVAKDLLQEDNVTDFILENLFR